MYGGSYSKRNMYSNVKHSCRLSCRCCTSAFLRLIYTREKACTHTVVCMHVCICVCVYVILPLTLTLRQGVFVAGFQYACSLYICLKMAVAYIHNIQYTYTRTSRRHAQRNACKRATAVRSLPEHIL